MSALPEVFCVYRCMNCGRTAFRDAKLPEPDGWDYDDDEAEYVCPEHAARLT